MKYPAYPNYKDSGVPWLGEVPGHWEVKRLGHVTLLKSGDSITSEQIAEGGEFPVYGGNGLRGYYSSFTHNGAFILIGRQGALCGNINYATGRFWASEHAVVVDPLKPFAVKWLGELLYAMNLNQYSISAAQPGLSVSQIGSLKIPVPQADEQTAIADFLDRETGRIDTLVAKKRRLIALLKEKRAALISRTVTRGLPAAAAHEFGLEPHTRFKDSGIEWLGEVPEGWAIRPIKSIVSTPVTDGPHETPEIFDEGIPFVSAEAINGGRINFDRIRGYISEEDHKKYSKKYKPEFGDIYMVKSGATTGRIAMVETNDEFNIWSPLAAIRCNTSLMNRKFVYFFLQSKEFQKAVELSWSFGTQQNIGMGVVQNLAVPVGSLPEQTAIATYLDRETAKIDRLVEKVETAIARLQEYRTALITATVTGKIDVRCAQDQDQEAAA